MELGNAASAAVEEEPVKLMKWNREILHEAQSVVRTPFDNERPLASPVF